MSLNKTLWQRGSVRAAGTGAVRACAMQAVCAFLLAAWLVQDGSCNNNCDNSDEGIAQITCCKSLPWPFDDNIYYHQGEGWDFGDMFEEHFLDVAEQKLCPAIETAMRSSRFASITSAGMDLSELGDEELGVLHDAYYSLDQHTESGPYPEINGMWEEDQRIMRATDHTQHSNEMFANLSSHGFVRIDRYPGLDVDAQTASREAAIERRRGRRRLRSSRRRRRPCVGRGRQR